jgi:hypothetical protein
MLSSYILRMAEAGERAAIIEQGAYRSRLSTYAQVLDRSLAFRDWLQERNLASPNNSTP